jgi:hypothetical protein
MVNKILKEIESLPKLERLYLYMELPGGEKVTENPLRV